MSEKRDLTSREILWAGAAICLLVMGTNALHAGETDSPVLSGRSK